MKRKLSPKRSYDTTIPSRADNPLPRGFDRDRRRFLRQLTAGAGAICLVGLPATGRSQGVTVQFYGLDRHPATDPLDPSESPPPEPDERIEVREEHPVPDDPERLPPGVEVVEENRALWVEPGYLLLVRWTRPTRNNTPVAALEGAGPTIEEFLRTSVTSVDQLHNLDRLHRLESELARILQGIVAPATIDVLHLDHDCAIVCSALDPGFGPMLRIETAGEMPAPGWE